MDDENLSKQNIEFVIKCHGGTIVQNPTSDKTLILSAKPSGIKMENLKKTGKHSILDAKAFLSKLKSGAFLTNEDYFFLSESNPKDPVLHTNKKQK